MFLASMLKFIIIANGQTTTERLSLEEAAVRLAEAYTAGENVEARAATKGRAYRLLTMKETEALAYAAALEMAR